MLETIRKVAREYWKIGCNIVLLKDKKPVHDWKKWETERQTEQEFNDSPWDSPNQFAVICGVRLNNGFYMGVLDLDIEKAGETLSQEVLGRQGKVASSMPVTQLEDTPSGGMHLVYYSKAPVQSKTYDDCGIEILGAGKLCIMAPSKGYIRSNDSLPSEVQDLNLKFEEALEKVGLKAEPTKVQRSAGKRGRRKAEQVRYCCEVVLERDRHVSHLMRLTVAAEYKKAGWSEDDVVDLFRSQDDFDREKCLTQVRSADPDKAATCKSIKEWGYCYTKCPLREWTLEEAIDQELKVAERIELHPYMDYHSETGLTVGAFLQASGKILQIIDTNVKAVNSESLLVEGLNPMTVSVKQPSSIGISKNQLKEMLLVSRELQKGSIITKEAEKNVSGLLLQKALHYYYHSDQRWHLAISCFVIVTYHHRLFPILGHLVFQGQRESGKSTIGTFLKSVCWNPTSLQAGLRSAPLFRSIEAQRPTFFADMTKINVRDVDLVDLFEIIEQDGCVRRCVGEDNEPIDFYVFCPKIIMVRQTVPFSHKCIECVTEPAPRGTPYTERRRFITTDPELKDVRMGLLRMAIYNWRSVLAAYEGLQSDEKLYGRRLDLWRPLLAVCKIYYPDRYNDLLSLAYEDAEKAEKGDVTSDVEDALLAYFLTSKGDSQTFLLRALTEHAQNQLGSKVVRSYHIVASALKNLGIVKNKQSTSDGVKYQIDLAKAHTVAGERRIATSSEGQPEEQLTLMASVKDWCRAKRDERGEIVLEKLASFIKEELGQEPKRVIEEAFNQSILMHSPKPGMAVVV